LFQRAPDTDLIRANFILVNFPQFFKIVGICININNRLGRIILIIRGKAPVRFEFGGGGTEVATFSEDNGSVVFN
jgi:hypothetical protein